MKPRIYPAATSIVTPEAMGIGLMASGWPVGVTVHYTADGDVEATYSSLMKMHLGYHLVIDRDGTVHQFTYLDLMVAHAGQAKWLGKSPNRAHASVALVSWGALDNHGCNWVGEKIPQQNQVMRRGNLGTRMQLWEKATDAQERALLAILAWFVDEGVLPGNICGHDECALPTGRKNDPGGVLSMTMAELRSHILIP